MKKYNQGGMLDTITVRFKDGKTQPIINHIEYDANGQRTRVEYENGVTTEYDYEPTTLNLIKLYSTRKAEKSVLQNIFYTYDPVGNITRLCDKTYETVFYNNAMVKPMSDYTYDALYRLIQANGRQHPGINARTYRNNQKDGDFKQSKAFIPISDSSALENYTEKYTYDDGGNLIKIHHAGISNT